jgi:hypothetical protein
MSAVILNTPLPGKRHREEPWPVPSKEVIGILGTTSLFEDTSVLGSCKNFTESGRVEGSRWLSVALLCIKMSIELANNGLKFKNNTTRKLRKEFVFCDEPLSFIERIKIADLLEPFADCDDAEVVQRACVENYQKRFEELKHHWTTTLPGQGDNGLKVIELFETLASRTKTLPIGQVLLHEMGFTEWTNTNVNFQEKWSGEHSMWFTPLYDREDFQHYTKSNEATVLKLSETTHKVLVTRCIAGILNLDAYEPASGRRNPGDRTGFRIFTDTLKMLCTLGDDTDGENAFTKEKCNILYDNVTKGGAGLGRDRSLPIFIQHAFSGWIQKYDKKSSLERAIILTRYARTRCHYEAVEAEAVKFDLID